MITLYATRMAYFIKDDTNKQLIDCRSGYNYFNQVEFEQFISNICPTMIDWDEHPVADRMIKSGLAVEVASFESLYELMEIRTTYPELFI